jgi:4-hydroxybenzoate polyprenyltransferase
MSAVQSTFARPYTPFSAWLTMARVSNSPTVATNVLVGAALAGAFEASGAIALLVAAFVIFYTAGMVLNDVCDYGWDQTHRPDRPLVVGAVSRNAALAATLAMLALGSALLWVVSTRAFLAGLVLIGLIVLYDTWHKSNPLSPVVMAGCRLMVYVGAFVAFAWPISIQVAIAGGVLVLYMVCLTAIAKRGASGHVVALLIAGISLVDGLIMLWAQAPLWWLLLAVLAYGLTLLLQRVVEGT